MTLGKKQARHGQHVWNYSQVLWTKSDDQSAIFIYITSDITVRQTQF